MSNRRRLMAPSKGVFMSPKEVRRHRATIVPGTETDIHGDKTGVLTLTSGDAMVGQLSWRNRVLQNVFVHPTFRRQGIARALWDEANVRSGLPITHSPDRTADGDAWAHAVGGDVPQLLHALRPIKEIWV